MRVSVPALLFLGVLTGLASVSCGGKADNPAAPQATAPSAVAPGDGEEVADLASGAADVSASSHISIQRWTFKDACSDNRGIRFRLFDLELGLQTKVFKIKSGQSRSLRVACYTDNKICTGAEQDPPGTRSWGVGIDGDRRQSKAACRPCSKTSQTVTYKCTKSTVDGMGEIFGDDELAIEE